MPASASRLFVQEALAAGALVTLPREAAHYLGRVLRLRPGDELTLFDGRGGEFAATVGEVTKQRVVVRVGERSPRERESVLSIRLVQGISRGERMDVAVQKTTELGVARITPIVTEFSVVRPDRGKRESRVGHWTRIARSACEQCGRNRVPQVDVPLSFDEWLRDEGTDGASLRILLDPGAAQTLASIGEQPAGVDLLVGPEGGLSDGEREQAIEKGFIAVAMGPRILRTETAAIAAVAMLQARWGDLT